MRWSIMMVLLTSACGGTRDAMVAAPPPASPRAAEPTADELPPAPELWVATDGATTYTLTTGPEGPALVTPDVATATGTTSCVEVVGVEADAMLVRVGTVTNGTCVLTDRVLRFARQTQR